jgi:rubrerythrin
MLFSYPAPWRKEVGVFSIGEILDFAIVIEKNGEGVYQGALASVSDPSLKKVLKWLAEEEARHIEWLAQIRAEFDEKALQDRPGEEEQKIFKKIIEGQSFSLAEKDLTKIDTVESLLGLALEFEKDTVVFYEMLGAFIQEPGALQTLKRIIEEEERHVQYLEELLTQGTRRKGE